MERHGADALDRLIQAIREAAIEIVGRHGGVVNEWAGPEIVSLFGVPIAHEDDYLRALQAASELPARVREPGRTAAAPARWEQQPAPAR